MINPGLHGRNQYAVGVSAALAAQLCWGSMPVFQRYFGRFVDVYTQNGIRCSAAAVFLLPALLWMIHRGRVARTIWLEALIPGVLATLSQTTWTFSLYRIDAGFAYFVAELQVIWAAMLAMWFFRDERALARSPKFWAATLLAGLGFAALVVGARHPDASHQKDLRMIWEGVGYAAACSVTSGVQTVVIRWRFSNYPAAAGFASIAIYMAIFLSVEMFWLGDYQVVCTLQRGTVLTIVMTGLVGIAVANCFWFMGLKRIGVTVSYGIALLAPFATALISTVTLREPMTGLQWIGGTVVVAGVVVLLAARRDVQGPALPVAPAGEPEQVVVA